MSSSTAEDSQSVSNHSSARLSNDGSAALQNNLETPPDGEMYHSSRRGTDPLTKLFLTSPGTSVKTETTRKRLQQTSEVRHSREDLLLLHGQESPSASPETERRLSRMKDMIEERTTVRETSSVAILGKRVQREFRSAFRLPDGMVVAVRREETYNPDEKAMELRVFLATACPPNVKYGGSRLWRKSRKPHAIADFLDDNALASSLLCYSRPVDVELARVQAAAEQEVSPLLRRPISSSSPSEPDRCLILRTRNHDQEEGTDEETGGEEELEEEEEEEDDEFGTTI